MPFEKLKISCGSLDKTVLFASMAPCKAYKLPARVTEAVVCAIQKG